MAGPIPPELGNLASLEGLGLGGDNLTGAIPRELGRLDNFSYFNTALFVPDNADLCSWLGSLGDHRGTGVHGTETPRQPAAVFQPRPP